ncbi:TMEM175 family protein [Streptomyces sp. NPDC057199]|uniref:TMEM175 family protein n=1 Tax=Streptomyces sp. NPDC057199 TaxID=3346047 RepID=UPI0036455A26
MNNRSSGRLRREVSVGPERLLLLGDAVFSIAMTLLALEITVPEGLPDSEVAHAVREALPAIGAYLLSFAVIGILWLAQHALFRLIGALDRWLLYFYFALLALVAALPFPTRLLNEYGDTTTATAFYGASIAVAGTLLCAMYLRLLAKPALTATDTSPAVLKEAVRRSVLLILVFATSVPVAFFSPSLAKYWWLLAFSARLPARRSRDTAEVPTGEAR